jgi:hypothetical protein
MRLKCLFFVIGVFAILPNILLAQAGNLKIEPRNCFSEVSIVVNNESKSRITILTGDFTGLSLKAGQTSNEPKKQCTGPIVVAIQFDKQNDDESTGRNFDYAVIVKILAEGDSVITITDRDLELVGRGEKFQKRFDNYEEIPFIITGGDNEGTVIASGSEGNKLMVNNGWNVAVWQYPDSKGNPLQSFILFIANKNKTRLVITMDESRKCSSNQLGVKIADWTEDAKLKKNK